MTGALPQRILIVRLSAMGDVIMASGVLPCLRAAFPGATIGWLTEAGNADLLRHNPRLDRLFLWPRRRWRDLRAQGRSGEFWREFLALRRALRDQRFDWVLDLQGLLKSGVWTWLAGGKERIGLGSREGSRLLMTRVIDRSAADRRIGKEYRKLVEELGAAPDRFACDIEVGADDARRAAALLRQAGIPAGYAIFCPFTTRPQKHWIDERWAALAGLTSDRLDLTPVFVGGPGERRAGEALALASGGRAVSLAGQTSLGECAALIRSASLVIGVDTGLTHLGIALQRPTLALFGSTRPYLDPASESARVLYQALPCSPCRRNPTCDGDFTCMRLHTVGRVFEAAREVLADPG